MSLRGLLVAGAVVTVLIGERLGAPWTWPLCACAAFLLAGAWRGSPAPLRLGVLLGFVPAVALGLARWPRWSAGLLPAVAWFWLAGNGASWTLAGRIPELQPFSAEERRLGARLAVLNGAFLAGAPLPILASNWAFSEMQSHWPLFTVAKLGWALGALSVWALLYLLIRDLWIGWSVGGAPPRSFAPALSALLRGLLLGADAASSSPGEPLLHPGPYAVALSEDVPAGAQEPLARELADLTDWPLEIAVAGLRRERDRLVAGVDPEGAERVIALVTAAGGQAHQVDASSLDP